MVKSRSAESPGRFSLTSSVVAVCLAAVCYYFILINCGRGFDFSDEGFYLNSISAPHLYSNTLSQFGFLYHPVFVLVGGDLVLFRSFNVVLTAALSGFLVWTALGSLKLNWLVRLEKAAALSIVGLLGLQVWLVTPNYNWLNLHLLLVVAIGVIELAKPQSAMRQAIAAAIVGIAIGGIVLVKPPSGALMVCSILFLYWFGAFKNFRVVAVVLGCGGLTVLLAAFAIDGTFGGFLTRVLTGFRSAYTLDANYGFAKTQELLKGLARMVAILASVLVLSVASSFAIVALVKRRPLAVQSWYACVFLLFGIAIFVVFYGEQFPYGNNFRAISFVIAAISLGVVIVFFRHYGMPERCSRVLCIWLVMLPFIFAVGTGTNLLLLAGHAHIFFVVAAIIFMGGVAGVDFRQAAVLEVVPPFYVAVTVVLIGLSMGHPQRQLSALKDQTSVARIGNASVKVDEETANYLERLNEMRIQAGGIGTLLDFTGRLPGNAFILNAVAPGRPWILSGYSGSEAFLLETLNALSCEVLAGSWIVADPSSDNSFPISYLGQVGLSSDKHYEEVEKLRLPGTIRNLTFYRPSGSRANAVRDCELARKR